MKEQTGVGELRLKALLPIRVLQAPRDLCTAIIPAGTSASSMDLLCSHISPKGCKAIAEVLY